MNDFLNLEKHDTRDPNPWLAMYLDNSIPMNETTKQALMRDNNSRSKRYLFPLIKFWAKITMFFFHIFKFFFPRLINAPKTLHKILAWGLKRFVSPDANLLIFRHFHVGSEILHFVANNVDGIEIKTNPLKPKDFVDVKDNLFLNHDLNLYNFIIALNRELQSNNVVITKKDSPDLSMISEDQFDHIKFPKRWTNILDLRSAIELFTPFYQFFLTANDFVRATNSLQLDETIAIYSAQILGTPAHLGLVNNRHPMVPVSTYSAGYRLVLHGLAAESLHEVLVNIKKERNRDGVIMPE